MNTKKNKSFTIYSKVILLLLLISIGFILLFTALFYYNEKQQKEHLKSASIDLEREINAVIDLNAFGYSSLITDITFWDELVNFVENKNIVWFDNSLAYLVDTYKSDYVGVYDLENQFITKASSTVINTKDFIPKEVFPMLLKEKNIKFYVKIPEGIAFVFGATIHPSEDPYKNKSTPKGYFFIVKLMNEKYFQNLESISNSSAEYLIPGKTNFDKKGIYYLKEIKNIKEEKIASVVFKRNYKVDYSNTRTILLIMLIGFLFSIFILNLYAVLWAKIPLALIKEVLENKNMVAIESLKKIKGEFRYIGNLFEENFNQKIQLEETTKKAEESDKLKTAFLMNLSHEIRTPMNAIMGFSDLILNKELLESEKENYMKIIHHSGKNLVNIIDELIEISKIDSNLIEPKRSSINLKELIDTIFESVKLMLPKNKNIDFKLTSPNNSLKRNIITDGAKLSQIITNLLTNALKFTTEGFIVFNYDYDLKNKFINFSVKDSGKGIPNELQDKIFTRFNKIDFVSDEDNKGLGLGLAISKAYVEVLGGNISLKSEEGIGSTFFFSIPFEFDNETTKKTTKLVDEIDIGNEEIILVAEDDNINYLLIEKLLKTNNFKVVRAKNGQEAIDICKENKEIDLVLMDIKMPSIDGHEAYIKIREFNKNLPIIAQTSYSFPEEVEKIKETGFNDFLSKPINKDKLYLLVCKYLKKQI